MPIDIIDNLTIKIHVKIPHDPGLATPGFKKLIRPPPDILGPTEMQPYLVDAAGLAEGDETKSSGPEDTN